MLTGVILARNEEQNIIPCLRALERQVDEIILIDMESADRTVELARPYVDKLLTHPLVPNFDCARNLAIPEARYDWLWFVDADEWVTDQVGQMVNRLIQEQGDTFEAINIPFMSHFCGQWMRHCGWWPGYTCPRVLKRGHFEFSRTLHGGVQHTGREIRFPAEAATAIPHHSFKSVEHWVRKCNGYTTTESLQLAERGFQWDWRFATRMMVRDLWEHFEKHRAQADGDRGWILTWLASQYRWFSVAKLIDTAKTPLPPGSHHSVPASLDEVLRVMEQELAFFRKGSAQPPLGIVWRGPVAGDGDEGQLTRSIVHSLATTSRSVVLEPSDGGESDDALLRALSRGRRAKHVVTISVGLLTAVQPDIYATLNVLVTRIDPERLNTLPAQVSEFDELWVASEAERDALRRLGAVPERLRVVPSLASQRDECADVLAAIADMENRLTVNPPPPVTQRQIGLELEGEFFAGHSFSNINEQIARQLVDDERLAVTLRRRQGIAPTTEPPGSMQRLKSYFERALPHGPQVTIRHAFPPNWQRPETGHWVHIQPWEFGHLPPDWLLPLRDQVDEIWVPSRYVQDVYINSGVSPEKVCLIPWGVDLECFSPDAPPLKLPTENSFRFLFVGGTILRKGFDRVLDAYLAEFTRDDDVALVIKDLGTQTFYRNNFRDRILAALSDPKAPQIVYIEAGYTPDQLASLYTACHCLVAPYRGEGFCLPVLEAMACGLPVIVPQGGPTDDFVTAEAGIFLPSQAVETRVDAEPLPGMPFTELHVEVADVRQAMRQMIGVAGRGDMGRCARAIAVQYPWSRTTRLMADRVAALASRSDHGPLAGSNQRLAACVVVRDDERRLADLLCRVRPYVDELIVAAVDSRDRSAQVAREYGADVLTMENVDTDAAFREAAGRTECPWIVCLKGTDLVVKVAIQELRDRIAAASPDLEELPGTGDDGLVLRRRQSLTDLLAEAIA